MWLYFLAISLCYWPSYNLGAPIKYSSSCSVATCGFVAGNSNGCSSSLPCYTFQTSSNGTLCAPSATCSLFDACISGTRCSSNTSVCVLDSCCSVPVCMPLSLASACIAGNISNIGTTTNAPSISSGNTCRSGTWNQYGAMAVPGSIFQNNTCYMLSFSLDAYNNYIASCVGYSSNMTFIFKIPANNASAFSIVGTGTLAPGRSYYYNYWIYSGAQFAIAVDSNGVVYTSEGELYYNGSMTILYYSVKMYGNNNSTTPVTVFGPTTCGQGADQICGANGLSLDAQGSIYYSDSFNHRILKITPFISTALVVAGTNGTAGSMNNQLSNPGGIYVDKNGTLYVVDRGNLRIIMFAPGNSYGTVLLALAFYHNLNDLTLDKAGNIYFMGYGGVYKLVPTSGSVTQALSGINWYPSRLQIDSDGNLYLSGSYNYNNGIVKHSIFTNTC